MIDFSYFDDKSVLFFGATGRLGKTLIEQALQSKAHRIAIMSREERSLVSMRAHFAAQDNDRLRFFLGDIRENARLMKAFDGVDVVVFADCFSSRDLLDYNPMEAVQSNITAYQNLANAAIERSVSQVIIIEQADFFLQRDLYDATKTCAEKIMVSFNGLSSFRRTKFSLLRIGDIWDFPDYELYKLVKNQKLESLKNYVSRGRNLYRFGCSVEDLCKKLSFATKNLIGGEILIPKLEGYRLTDYVNSLWPESKVTESESGLSGSAQLNFVSESESKQLWDTKNFYIVAPDASWWDKDQFLKSYPEAKQVPSDFIYLAKNAPLKKF